MGFRIILFLFLALFKTTTACAPASVNSIVGSNSGTTRASTTQAPATTLDPTLWYRCFQSEITCRQGGCLDAEVKRAGSFATEMECVNATAVFSLCYDHSNDGSRFGDCIPDSESCQDVTVAEGLEAGCPLTPRAYIRCVNPTTKQRICRPAEVTCDPLVEFQSPNPEQARRYTPNRSKRDTSKRQKRSPPSPNLMTVESQTVEECEDMDPYIGCGGSNGYDCENDYDGCPDDSVRFHSELVFPDYGLCRSMYTPTMICASGDNSVCLPYDPVNYNDCRDFPGYIRGPVLFSSSEECGSVSNSTYSKCWVANKALCSPMGCPDTPIAANITRLENCIAFETTWTRFVNEAGEFSLCVPTLIDGNLPDLNDTFSREKIVRIFDSLLDCQQAEEYQLCYRSSTSNFFCQTTSLSCDNYDTGSVYTDETFPDKPSCIAYDVGNWKRCINSNLISTCRPTLVGCLSTEAEHSSTFTTEQECHENPGYISCFDSENPTAKGCQLANLDCPADEIALTTTFSGESGFSFDYPTVYASTAACEADNRNWNRCVNENSGDFICRPEGSVDDGNCITNETREGFTGSLDECLVPHLFCYDSNSPSHDLDNCYPYQNRPSFGCPSGSSPTMDTYSPEFFNTKQLCGDNSIRWVLNLGSCAPNNWPSNVLRVGPGFDTLPECIVASNTGPG